MLLTDRKIFRDHNKSERKTLEILAKERNFEENIDFQPKVFYKKELHYKYFSINFFEF